MRNLLNLFNSETQKKAIAVWVPFESIALAHYICCWWSLWKMFQVCLSH